MDACFAAPDLVAGEGRFDTISMRGLPDLAFAKGGAEGVHCAALPALGIGIAVKVDDGTKRGAEMVLAVLLAKLVAGAEEVLASQLAGEMRTWRGVKVGAVAPSPALKAAVRALPRQSAAAAASR
jgi:L-asparaginase II